MTHDELVAIARTWLAKPWRNASSVGHGSCSVVITDMTSAAWETPDALGWHSGGSTLVECKTSRSDFKADKKKYVRQHPEKGVGDWRYFMVPKGLLAASELPDGWGLIEVNDDSRTRVVKASGRFKANRWAENTMLLSLLCRLKVKTGRHVKIRAYNMDDGNEPRATVTLNRGQPVPEVADIIPYADDNGAVLGHNSGNIRPAGDEEHISEVRRLKAVALEARSRLSVALTQSIDSDDKIIMGHVRDAVEILGGEIK